MSRRHRSPIAPDACSPHGVSLTDRQLKASFSGALLAGLAPDGGLWIPDDIPYFAHEEAVLLGTLEFPDCAAALAERFVYEHQLCTIGGQGSNVTAISVDGTFDDCQQLAKDAFADKDLSAAHALMSANTFPTDAGSDNTEIMWWRPPQLGQRRTSSEKTRSKNFAHGM